MLKNFKVLYVEDEELIQKRMLKTLEFMSADVVACSDGESALEAYILEKPDIIIADIEIPRLNGLDFVKRIRQKDKDVQILITTAYTNTEYLLKATELKLTKYLVKPIKLLELEEALKQCVENLTDVDNKIYFNDVDYFDTQSRLLFIDNKEVHLEFQELKLLELLISKVGNIVTYKELEEKIWKANMSEANIRTRVYELRKKLPKGVIKNISKTGYKLVV